MWKWLRSDSKSLPGRYFSEEEAGGEGWRSEELEGIGVRENRGE